MTRVRGIRGATTADNNTKDNILLATRELLERLIEANDIDSEDVAAVFFTTTLDLNAEFPALAARQMGWGGVALLCGHEMKVPNGLRKCIRTLILVNTDKPSKHLTHVYMRGATDLKTRGMEEA